MSITNKLNQIKNAIYGKEVRGAIHDAIKQVYDDASVNHDNANMEVKMARGTHNTLNDRLDNVDEIQAQTNAQLSEISEQNSRLIYKTDNESLQQALDRAKNKQSTLELKPITYNLTEQIVIDLSKCSVKGNGAILDFSNAPDNLECIKIICSNSNPYRQNGKFLEGFEIIGKGKDSKQIAIIFDSDNPSHATSHLDLRGINIRSFYKGIDYKTFVYLIRHYSVDVSDCHYGIYTGNDGEDYGENINFFGCAIYNSTIAVYHNNPNGSFHFTSSSLDYCNESFIISERGRVFFQNGHIEGNAQVQGNVNIQNSWIILQSSDEKIIFNVPDKTNKILIESCFINTAKINKKIAEGNGEVIFKDCKHYTVSNFATNILNENSTLIPTKALDLCVHSGTKDKTDRYTVKNCIITKNEIEQETGNHCWKIMKEYGKGSNSSFRILIPTKRNNRFKIRLRVKSTVDIPEKNVIFTIIKSYVSSGSDNFGIPMVLDTSKIGDIKPAISTQWKWIELATNVSDVESYYNYIIIECSLFHWESSGNSIFIDRIEAYGY